MSRVSKFAHLKPAALKLLSDGASVIEVAKKLSIHRSTVEAWYEKNIENLGQVTSDELEQRPVDSKVKILRVLPKSEHPSALSDTTEAEDLRWIKHSARTLFDTSEHDPARVSALRVYLEAIRVQRSIVTEQQTSEEEETEELNAEVYSALDTESLVRLYKDSIA